MDQILKDFGVQPILLAAQAVNFLILLFILNKFLYKPVLRTLDERKQKIAQSLKDAEEIEKRLAKLELDKEKVLEKAANEARKIIAEATESGNQVVAAAHLKAQHDIGVMLAKSQTEMNLEKDRLNQEIRESLADMIADGLRVISGKVLSEKDKKELLQNSLKNIN